MLHGRCEICTLIPPCKHHKTTVVEPPQEPKIIDDSLFDPGSQQQASFRENNTDEFLNKN